MRHIHTYIVSVHLATGDNNKILRTAPPHIDSSEEILPHLTSRTLAKLRTNKSPFFKRMIHTYTKHRRHHCFPTVTPTYTTHIMSSYAPTCTPRCHPRSDRTAGPNAVVEYVFVDWRKTFKSLTVAC